MMQLQNQDRTPRKVRLPVLYAMLYEIRQSAEGWGTDETERNERTCGDLSRFSTDCRIWQSWRDSERYDGKRVDLGPYSRDKRRQTLTPEEQINMPVLWIRPGLWIVNSWRNDDGLFWVMAASPAKSNPAKSYDNPLQPAEHLERA